MLISPVTYIILMTPSSPKINKSKSYMGENPHALKIKSELQVPCMEFGLSATGIEYNINSLTNKDNVMECIRPPKG